MVEQLQIELKIKYLEGLAMGIWKTKLWVTEGTLSGHCKSYDPLTIIKVNNNTWEVLSYIFDFSDGGRSHSFKTLDEIEEALFNEIKVY